MASCSSIDAADKNVLFDGFAVHFEIYVLAYFSRFVTNKQIVVIINNKLAVGQNLHCYNNIAAI